MTTEDT